MMSTKSLLGQANSGGGIGDTLQVEEIVSHSDPSCVTAETQRESVRSLLGQSGGGIGDTLQVDEIIARYDVIRIAA